MQYEEEVWYSERLNRNMKIRVYGHYGIPILCFPCQDKQSDDFANNGMIDNLSDYIEDGRIKLYCVDSNDEETVSNKGWDKAYASYMLDQYHEYIVNEVLPYIYDKQGGWCLPYVFGMSMGASHSVNHFFRRPDLFAGFIALSGNYDIASFFEGYMDSHIYNNSPVHYLANLPLNHPYINMYNEKKMIVVVGQGAWEHLVYYSNTWLKDITDNKGIHVNYNFWDENSTHDWPSWKYQIRYFINFIL